MKKLSAILAVLMLVSMLSLSAFAAGDATFTVSNAQGKPGDTVTVTVAFKNNPGIVGAQLDLKFDPSVLTVESYTMKATGFYSIPFETGSDKKDGTTEQKDNSKVTLVLANILLQKVEGDFTVAEVSFKIADTAADGLYEIKVDNYSAYTYDPNAGADAKKSFPYVNVVAGKAVVAVSKDGSLPVPKFVASRIYADNFSDVPADAWFHTYVKTAYEYTLANGTGGGKFSPDGTFTVAEALTAAVNIHRAYTGNALDTAGAKNWYDPYVAYCVANGIIKEGQFDNYTRKITRGEMSVVFANILPESEYAAVRTKDLPDVTDDMSCAAAVRKLANAGIVGGDAGTGKFRPNDSIKRSEASVIFTRIAVASMRDAK